MIQRGPWSWTNSIIFITITESRWSRINEQMYFINLRVQLVPMSSKMKTNFKVWNTSLKLPVGVSPLQLGNLHRNRRYFVIKLHTWFCLSYFLKTNIQFYCIYQYFMSINSFFNTENNTPFFFFFRILNVNMYMMLFVCCFWILTKKKR